MNIADLWLQGRNPEEKPYERFERLLLRHKKAPPLELVWECLMYSQSMGEPLPDALTSFLSNEILLLMAGDDSGILQRAKGKTALDTLIKQLEEKKLLEDVERLRQRDKLRIDDALKKLDIPRATYYSMKKRQSNPS